MENTPANRQPIINPNQSKQKTAKTHFTPRELIYYHMEHPDVPISDADMENLVLVVNNNNGENRKTPAANSTSANDKRMFSDEEIKQMKSETIGTSYDILDS